MNKNGFTLVELLAVIVILAVVMLIGGTVVLPMMQKAQKTTLGEEGLNIIKASDDAFIEEITKGPRAEYNTTSSVCYDIKFLCEHGYFEKGCGEDGYTGSVLSKYNGNGNKEYYFWISNGTYVYNGASKDTYSDLENESIVYSGSSASTDCGKTEPSDISEKAKAINVTFRNQGYIYVNSTGVISGDENTLAAGFYDDSDNLIVSWEDSGIDVSIDYTDSSIWSISTSGYNITNKYSNATKIVIPNTVTRIGNYALYFCSKIKSVIIPESVTSIGKGAFGLNLKLESITIPKKVTILPDGLFNNCMNLTTVNILGNVTSIGTAFQRCRALKTITIPEGVTKIDANAFEQTGIESITLPKTLKSIDGQAFYGSGLKSIVVPEGVTSINYLAFAHSEDLKSVVLPDSLTSLSTQVFMECTSLEEITIPRGVKSLKVDTFSDCKSLKSITYKGTKAEWNAISRGQNWKYNVPASCIVHCIDGDINI